MISIVTVTFNNYEELIQTLKSIQNEVGIESIVVNGGTCERTSAFLKTYSGIVISEKDQGISDAFNKGARAARGESIAFLNSGDVLIEPGYYQKVATALESNAAAYTYADLVFNDHIAGKMLFKSRHASLKDIGRGMPFPHPTFVVKKNVFEDVGEFKLNYKIGMDYEWLIRLLLKGHKGVYIQTAPVLMDGTGISSTQQEKSIMECRRALLEHKLLSGKVKRDQEARMLKLRAKEFIHKLIGEKSVRFMKRIKNL